MSAAALDPSVERLVADDGVTGRLRDVVRDGRPAARLLAAAIIFLSLFLGVLLIYTAAFGTITGYLQRIVFVFAIVSLGLLAKSPAGTPWHRRGLPSLMLDTVIVALLSAAITFVVHSVRRRWLLEELDGLLQGRPPAPAATDGKTQGAAYA